MIIGVNEMGRHGSSNRRSAHTSYRMSRGFHPYRGKGLDV